MRIEIDGVVYSYGTKQAIHKITFHVDRGEFVGIIGSNGSGNSMVLENVYRGFVLIYLWGWVSGSKPH